MEKPKLKDLPSLYAGGETVGGLPIVLILITNLSKIDYIEALMANLPKPKTDRILNYLDYAKLSEKQKTKMAKFQKAVKKLGI